MLNPGAQGSQPEPPAGEVSLWGALRLSGDPAVRERLIEYHLPFARVLAAKAYAKRPSRELEFADYLQYASLGLMEAVDRFDVERNIKFETFAAPRISGAISNGIQSLSEKQEQVSARRRIVSDRVASMKDAAPAGQDPNAVFSYLAELAIGLAVGYALEDSGMHRSVEEPAYADNAYQSVELKLLHQRALALLDALPANERKVVAYHYLQQLTFEEIAGMLSVTKGRVSQIHKTALHRLRRGFQRDDGMDLSC